MSDERQWQFLAHCPPSGDEQEEAGGPNTEFKGTAEELPRASRDSWMTETAGRDILTGRIAEPPDADADKSKADSKPKVGRVSRLSSVL